MGVEDGAIIWWDGIPWLVRDGHSFGGEHVARRAFDHLREAVVQAHGLVRILVECGLPYPALTANALHRAMEDAGYDTQIGAWRAKPLEEGEVEMGEAQNQTYTGYAVLELLGHRTRAGYVSEAMIAGAAFLRVDIPQGDVVITEYYSAASLYALSPCDEATARLVAGKHEAGPVDRYDLEQAVQARYGEETTALREQIRTLDRDLQKTRRELWDLRDTRVQPAVAAIVPNDESGGDDDSDDDDDRPF